MSTGPQLPTSIAGWAIWLVILIAIVGLVYVMLQVTGIIVPQWVWTILLILLVAFIVVKAIQFLASMGSNP